MKMKALQQWLKQQANLKFWPVVYSNVQIFKSTKECLCSLDFLEWSIYKISNNHIKK